MIMSQYTRVDEVLDIVFVPLANSYWQLHDIPYFFGYKKGTFPFKTIKKIQIHLWNWLGKVKLVLKEKIYSTDLVVCSHSREEKHCLIAT